ncbi:similar to Saccharomyces cerevisiae YPL046C ELC1 Elongin C [Geotrichum candidum]|uniref:Elongin-C n=1 Tax=Geotrichum candidum TaxID=1173061 RepID=A0A0J9XH57_GEOCN|nr:similar to Saccharomyces cerevisiae YPL046C ELC1 Elongin C [Geotrichum candidum]
MSESTESKYVTLVSSDGFSFVVLREAALVSGTLRGMLSGTGFVESTSNIVKLPNISGILLEKVCEYLYFNLKYKNKTGVPQFEIPPELALEMLVVADFLDT